MEGDGNIPFFLFLCGQAALSWGSCLLLTVATD